MGISMGIRVGDLIKYLEDEQDLDRFVEVRTSDGERFPVCGIKQLTNRNFILEIGGVGELVDRKADEKTEKLYDEIYDLGCKYGVF